MPLGTTNSRGNAGCGASEARYDLKEVKGWINARIVMAARSFSRKLVP